ncbi:MAG: hypothetical protein ACPGU1_11230 [Myxococcota bacterium]
MRTLAPLIIALTALAGCFAEAPITGAQCNKERRCPGEHFCQGGRCQEGSPYVQSLLCVDDSECRAGTSCHPVDGLCVQCHAPEHCLTGHCTLAGSCAPCEADGQCTTTGRCNSYGFCAACLADTDCATGVSCLPGLGQCDDEQEDQRDEAGSVREERPQEDS